MTENLKVGLAVKEMENRDSREKELITSNSLITMEGHSSVKPLLIDSIANKLIFTCWICCWMSIPGNCKIKED